MTQMPRFKKLDVCPMLRRGEQPFPTSRGRVDALKPGEGLTLVCPFLPVPLLEQLHSEGLQSRVERAGFGGWVVYSWQQEI